jgi:hypothetical protein
VPSPAQAKQAAPQSTSDSLSDQTAPNAASGSPSPAQPVQPEPLPSAPVPAEPATPTSSIAGWNDDPTLRAAKSLAQFFNGEVVKDWDDELNDEINGDFTEPLEESSAAAVPASSLAASPDNPGASSMPRESAPGWTPAHNTPIQHTPTPDDEEDEVPF